VESTGSAFSVEATMGFKVTAPAVCSQKIIPAKIIFPPDFKGL
jgi:hypothetical protein